MGHSIKKVDIDNVDIRLRKGNLESKLTYANALRQDKKGGNEMAKKIVSTTFCLVIVSIVALTLFGTHASAQDAPVVSEAGPMINFKVLAGLIIEGVVFSIVGLIVLMIGYKVFDWATPYDLNRQIAEDNNTAAGIAVAGVLVALGIIVAAAMGG